MSGHVSLNRSAANAEQPGQTQGSTNTPERSQRSKVSCAKTTSGHNAFISYSHAEDNELAPVLQLAMQRFAKPLFCRRALRIFLDKSHLPLTPELWPQVEKTLASSQYFLLLASPRAAQSPWVQREVAWWLRNKPPTTLLLVQTAGKDLNWSDERGDFDWDDVDALPKNLRGTFAHDPLRLDLRWTKDEGVVADKDPRFPDAVATIAAMLHDIPKDELIGQDLDQHRRTLRITRIVAAVLTVLLVLVVLTGANWFVALGEARRLNSQLFAAQADTVYQEEDLERAALLARAAFDSADTPLARRALLQSIADGPTLTLSRNDPVDDPEMHVPFVRDVAFSPAGDSVASLDGNGELRLWHLESTAAPSAQADIGYGFMRLAFAPDSATIIVAGEVGAKQCNAKTLDNCDAVYGGVVESIAFHPSGEYLILGGATGEVLRWNVGDASTATLDGPSNLSQVNAVAVTSNGRIAAGHRDGTVTLWSEDGNQSWQSLTPPSLGDEQSSEEQDWPAIKSLAFDPAGALLMAGDADGNVVAWDLSTPTPEGRAFHQGSRAILRLIFNAAGSELATSDETPETVIWDVEGREPVVTLDHGFIRVTSAAISPDFSRIATGDQLGGTRIWPMTGPPLARFPPSNIGFGEITSVAFEPGSRRFAVGGPDRSVRMCDLARGTLTCSGEHDTESQVTTLAFSAGGEWLAVSEASGAITVRRRDGELQSISVPAGFHAESLAIDEAHDLLAAGGMFVDPTDLSGTSQHAVITASLETWQLLDRELGLPAAPVLSFSPACPVLLIEIKNQTYAWPAATGTIDRANETVVDSIAEESRGLAFSADGTRLASGRADGSVVVWDVDCDVGNARLRDHMASRSGGTDAERIAFSSDARYLVSGHADGAVEIWDAENEEPLGLVARLQAPVLGVTWTDELSVIAVDALGTVVEVEGDPEKWKSIACQVAGRDFTANEASQFVGTPSYRACQDASGVFGLPNLDDWFGTR